jgi:ABC-type nitrate/sulfonate/bicarbonate transport system substrate-binding protein
MKSERSTTKKLLITVALIAVAALASSLLFSSHPRQAGAAGVPGDPVAVPDNVVAALNGKILGQPLATAEANITSVYAMYEAGITPTFSVNYVSNPTMPASQDGNVGAWSPGSNFPYSPFILNVITDGYSGTGPFSQG